VVSAVERIAGRRQVRQLIHDDPVTIVLHRREKIDTHGGGWKWGAETDLPPQTVALIPFKRRMTDFLVNTELGNVPKLPYTFLGNYDLDIQPDDWFDHNGDKFQVKTIDLKTEIRITGQVDYLGAEPT
jgi:hypothetical protein